MRVLELIDSLRPGGKERQFLELVKGLSGRSDVQCEVLLLSNEIHYQEIHEVPVRVQRLVRKGRRDPWMWARMYRFLRRLRPDVLHAWNSMCVLYALPAARILGIPVVNGFLRHVPPRLGLRDGLWWRARLSFPFSAAVVANTRAALEAYRAPADRSWCVYNGFDPARLEGLRPQAVVRRELGIRTRQVVGMVATFSHFKDYPTFLQAMQQVLRQRPDVTVLAVGDGPQRRRCREMVSPEFQDRILFPGTLARVEEVEQVCDVGVLCTNAAIFGEGLANALMEFMALGKPVVATNSGGTAELVVDGVTGFLVAPADPGAVARRVGHLLDHRDEADRMGRAGRRRIRQSFSQEQMVERFVTVYEQVLGRHPRARRGWRS